MAQIDDLVIDETNFSQYFRDVRTNVPSRGDVLARYTAYADFIDGNLKRDIINLLSTTEKAIPASNVMRKLGCATEVDSYRICKEICEDLAAGMSVDTVAEKPYKYQLEMFYYTKKEYVPCDDPHWSLIGIENLDDFLDKAGNKLEFNWKIIENEKR